jgi:hypothetical protein
MSHSKQVYIQSKYGGLAEVITLHYNSDLSGEVTVITQRLKGQPRTCIDIGPEHMNGPETRCEIPGSAFLALVADFVRSERISEIEHCSDRVALGLK